MADIVARTVRSRMMAAVKGKNTQPELLLRRALHAMGYRYRLHCRSLPGTPDLYFPSRRAVVHVNGCFWHGHDCRLFRWPATRRRFWRTKIGRTMRRDAENAERLQALGLRSLTVWECAIRGPGSLEAGEVAQRAAHWLETGTSDLSIRGPVSAGGRA